MPETDIIDIVSALVCSLIPDCWETPRHDPAFLLAHHPLHADERDMTAYLYKSFPEPLGLARNLWPLPCTLHEYHEGTQEILSSLQPSILRRDVNSH